MILAMWKYFQILSAHMGGLISGLIEILSPTITATETKMSVMLFKASALTAAES